MKIVSSKTALCGVMSLILAVSVVGQKRGLKAKASAKPAPLIFAVLNDGKTLEPIATVKNGKLETPTLGNDEAASLKAFSRNYYRPGTGYDLIFGGARVGKAIIKSNDPSAECGKNLAEITLSPAKTNIKGLVMALATNLSLKESGPGLRRMPTTEERAEIEKLVRNRFVKEGVARAELKELRYQNLTAVDVNGDGKAELVGSYWIAPKADERDLLFFITDGSGGSYSFGYSEFARVKPDDLMSGNVKDMDGGLVHELYIDEVDIDGDGTAEIFTLQQAFEGNNFLVYKRNGEKWDRVFETYNYHCAY